MNMLHMLIFKLIKEYVISFLSSEDILSHLGSPSGKRKPLRLYRMPMLRASNHLLAAIQRRCRASVVNIDLSKHEPSFMLTDVLIMECISGMMERKQYRSMELISSSLLHSYTG